MRKSRLDLELCFMLYCRLGTFRRVAEYLEQHNVVNRSTGKPYSQVTIFNALKNYPPYKALNGHQVDEQFMRLRKELGVSEQ